MELTLNHEVVHGHYKAGHWGVGPVMHPDGSKTKIGEFEDIIQDEAQRFYNENKLFVMDWFIRIMERYAK